MYKRKQDLDEEQRKFDERMARLKRRNSVVMAASFLLALAAFLIGNALK
ncbi:MAG: hypothetical protein LBN40_03985 [Oscillospiraceae bacterium]|jgi:hypothetical protein|nr:hypothetical protein [Oscillospiraceae bacterium]